MAIFELPAYFVLLLLSVVIAVDGQSPILSLSRICNGTCVNGIELFDKRNLLQLLITSTLPLTSQAIFKISVAATDPSFINPVSNPDFIPASSVMVAMEVNATTVIVTFNINNDHITETDETFIFTLTIVLSDEIIILDLVNYFITATITKNNLPSPLSLAISCFIPPCSSVVQKLINTPSVISFAITPSQPVEFPAVVNVTVTPIFGINDFG